MRDRFVALLVVTIGLSISSNPAFAHHGSAAYDTAKPIVVKGTVTEWLWSNPHCFLKFDAKNDAGTMVHWAVEVSNPADMVKRGWSDHSFKPGDEVTVTLLQAKNGNPVGRAQKVVLPNGQVLIGMEGTGAFPGGANNAKPPDNPKQ